MKDELQKEISLDEEVLESMPLTNERNKAKYVKAVNGLQDKYQLKLDTLLKELTKRLEPYKKLVPNNYTYLDDNLEEYTKALGYTTDLITPYEKLGLDKIVYNLATYQEVDDSFTYLNINILKALDIFNLIGVNLTEKDFSYTTYTKEYIKNLLIYQSDLSNQKLKNSFNTIYWQCPNLIMQIELNIRYLYLKYQKKFEKYIKLYISKISSEKELIKDYTIIRNNMDSIIKDDKNNLIYSFYQDKLNIDDYIPSKIDSIISKIYTDSSMINLYDVNTKLTNSLIEYKNYLKYINLIKKIKTLYKEEIEKDFLNKRLKQIAKLEAKLFKLTKKSSKRLSFAKVDKYTPEIDATIKEISDIYKEIDDNILKVKIKEQLKPNSTLFKALLLVGRNYSIAARFFMEEDSELTTIQLDKEIDELIYFTLNPSNTIITNLTIMDDNDIKEIIISNYRLFNVNLDSSTLESDIDNLINDLEKINIYYILNNFKIDILNLQSIKEGKKLLEKYNTQKDIE